MTNVQMLAMGRSLLDESSAGFFTDPEIYASFTEGQKQVANVFLSIYQKTKKLPEVFVPLVTSLVSSETTLDYEALPADFWIDIDLKYGTTVNTKQTAFKRDLTEQSFAQGNTYLNDDFFYTIDGANLNFEASPGSDHYYTLTYLKKVTTIDGSTSPTLHESSHTAIVHFGVSQMLIKDQKIVEAEAIMKLYTNELGALN